MMRASFRRNWAASISNQHSRQLDGECLVLEDLSGHHSVHCTNLLYEPRPEGAKFPHCEVLPALHLPCIQLHHTALGLDYLV